MLREIIQQITNAFATELLAGKLNLVFLPLLFDITNERAALTLELIDLAIHRGGILKGDDGIDRA
ncbi:hypothetical protein [Perlucidibaca piscinae]|uniref:hypothetical protein n=1 Tax=Perlucidibaca piscinae TaxID=392589 RepID=UPI00047E9881|nr:hypothetical protein [Perlucidibaca piscinae]